MRTCLSSASNPNRNLRLTLTLTLTTHLRLHGPRCLSSASASGLDAPALGGKYYVTVYSSHAMARRDARDGHNGLYSLSLLQAGG